jgi:hypothetical protein
VRGYKYTLSLILDAFQDPRYQLWVQILSLPLPRCHPKSFVTIWYVPISTYDSVADHLIGWWDTRVSSCYRCQPSKSYGIRCLCSKCHQYRYLVDECYFVPVSSSCRHRLPPLLFLRHDTIFGPFAVHLAVEDVYWEPGVLPLRCIAICQYVTPPDLPCHAPIPDSLMISERTTVRLNIANSNLGTFWGGCLTFGQSSPQIGWQINYKQALAEQGINTYFVPAFSDSPTAPSDMYSAFPVADGLMSWDSAWPWAADGKANVSCTTDEQYMAAAEAAGKTFVMRQSPHLPLATPYSMTDLQLSYVQLSVQASRSLPKLVSPRRTHSYRTNPTGLLPPTRLSRIPNLE